MLTLARDRIETERLILRLPVLDDAQRLAQLANHIEIARCLSTMPHPYGVQEAEDFIAEVVGMKTGVEFVVTLKPDAEVIGICGYGPAHHGDSIDFGYWLGLDYWGKGYAGEAAGAVLTHAFCVGQVDVLETECNKDNPRSKRLLDGLGFETIGDVESFSVGSGETVKADRVRLTCDDWLATKACA